MTERTLLGRYRLTERIGAGGMGVVWRADDLVLHREVAVKTVAGPGVTDEAAARLEREARAAAGLSDSPHVVTVHDFGRDGDTLFIVMALAPGRTLDRVLADDGEPAPTRALDWAGQVCAALEAAHARGVVHRDIKPANAVLGPDGTVRVLDFGIAWFHPDLGLDRLSRADGVLGSAPWMSPEQARGTDVGPASDLYSLGCLLHQLLTGEPPFGGRDALAQIIAHSTEAPAPPSAVRPGLPAALDRLVADLLAKDPGDRPASAAETAARLGAVARELGERETVGRAAAPGGSAAPANSVTSAAPSAPAAAPTDPADPPASEPGRRPVPRRTVLLGAFGVVAVSSTAAVVVPNVLDGQGDGGSGRDGGSSGGNSGNGGTKGSGSGAGREVTYSWRKKTAVLPFAEAGPVVLMNSQDNLVAYDPKSGRERWRGPKSLDSTHPMSATTLYVTADHGELRCLDPDTGKSRWTFDPLGDDDVSGGVFPEVAPESVYVGLGPYVFSLHHATGEERWRHDVEGEVPLVTALERPSAGLLLARDPRRAWFALSAVDGQPLWEWKFKAVDNPAFMGAMGDRLLFALDGTTVIDAGDGTVVDTFKDASPSEIVPEHKLLIGTERISVRAWSATDGKPAWTVPAAASPLVFGDTVLMIKYSDDRKSSGALAVDVRTGKKRWHHPDLRSPMQAEPDEPLILMVGGKGTGLVRVDPETGERGPVRRLPDKQVEWVQAFGDTVYAQCVDRPFDPKDPEADRGGPRLYAVDLKEFG
ncbi:PQQ-binding-like beta-propeller repeat protein [Streptomyces alboflavus]|uniref:protein kinase domain-containing protein n=1 Tax=Streptomyces alboflavus TaxID=67267 RepID=UPI0036A65D70